MTKDSQRSVKIHSCVKQNDSAQHFSRFNQKQKTKYEGGRSGEGGGLKNHNNNLNNNTKIGIMITATAYTYEMNWQSDCWKKKIKQEFIKTSSCEEAGSFLFCFVLFFFSCYPAAQLSSVNMAGGASRCIAVLTPPLTYGFQLRHRWRWDMLACESVGTALVVSAATSWKKHDSEIQALDLQSDVSRSVLASSRACFIFFHFQSSLSSATGHSHKANYISIIIIWCFIWSQLIKL